MSCREMVPLHWRTLSRLTTGRTSHPVSASLAERDIERVVDVQMREMVLRQDFGRAGIGKEIAEQRPAIPVGNRLFQPLGADHAAQTRGIGHGPRFVTTVGATSRVRHGEAHGQGFAAGAQSVADV